MNDAIKQYRRCSKCHADKPLDSRYFSRRTEATQRNAWRGVCISCQTERKKQLEAIAKARTHKRCSRCKEVLPVDAFFARKTSRDGRQAACKSCDGERDSKRQVGAVEDGERLLSMRNGKFCNTCGGLEHRVTGVRCRNCGLAFREERPVELVFRRFYDWRAHV